MIELLAALALLAQREDGFALTQPSFMRFSVDPAMGRGHREVTVGALPREGSRSHFWFRRTSPRDASHPGAYTTTRDCSAARAALESLEQLEVPALDVPGTGRESTEIILDGVGYRLEAYALHPGGQQGRVRLTSNVMTPLARWIDAMEAALAPCWRPQADPRPS